MAKTRDRDYGDCLEIVEACMEWIARRWTKSMIKRQLREYFPGLSASSCQYVITRAKQEIYKRFGIDPKDYKGLQISFYEAVIRGDAKVRDKLTAAERLDKLFGLETLVSEDPGNIAAKIIEFKKEAANTVGGQDNGGSEDEGARADDGVREEGITKSGSRQDIPSTEVGEDFTTNSKEIEIAEETEGVPKDMPSEVVKEITDIIEKKKAGKDEKVGG